MIERRSGIGIGRAWLLLEGALLLAAMPVAAAMDPIPDLLELVEQRTFLYFWENRHPATGFVRDRAMALVFELRAHLPMLLKAGGGHAIRNLG
jgi:hypothetical protein